MLMLKPRLFEAVLAILLLFMCVVMFVIVTAGKDVQIDAWNLTSAGPVSDIQVGDDGTLYVFSGEHSDTISAISPEGKLKWELKMPANWGPADRFFIDDANCIEYLQSGNVYGEKGPIYTTDQGQLYLYVGEIRTTDPGFTLYSNTLTLYSPENFGKYVVAISAEGDQLWKTEIRGPTRYPGDANLYAENSTVYVYDSDAVVGLDSAGSVISTIREVFSEPTVDEAGNLYVIKGFPAVQDPVTIESYDTNATLRWRTDIPGPIIYYFQPDSRSYNQVLLYYNRTLSVPMKNGIYRLDDTGNVTGVKGFGGMSYALFEPMPIDSQGNLYIVLNTVPSYTHVLSPDGKDLLRTKIEYNGSFKGDDGGVVYKVDYYLNNTTPASLTKADLTYANLTAYDIINDRYLWNYTFIPEGKELYASAETESAIESLFDRSDFVSRTEAYPATPGRAIQYYHQQEPGLDQWVRQVPDHPDSAWGMRLVSGKDVIYVNYYTGNRETWYGSRDYVFSNYLYAISKNGTLLWEKQVQSPITSMAVNNSTLYYGTQDGRLFAENTGLITGGLAIAAILYLFIRFFLAGTVARARDRLNKNENRNGIVKYVGENPGSTLRDISRGLDMNIGTVRYHTLILGINHRISAMQADEKHVRYFPATGQYSPEDRLVMSLVRRNGIKNVLGVLIDKPGLSNTELSRVLSMKESAVSRYMKILTDRGVVDRREVSGGSLAYSINSKMADSVDRAVKREKN